MFSDKVVASGFDCLRYDKRGIAESKLPITFDQKQLSFDFFIDDANGWVNEFSTDSRFDKIVLAGHSQGSLVALCVANKNEHVRSEERRVGKECRSRWAP